MYNPKKKVGLPFLDTVLESGYLN